MVSNLGRITKLAASPTTGMVDGIDSLHTGIVKALEIMAKGRMIIKSGTFTLSASGGHTRYSLVDPQYIYDGKVYSHSGTLTVDQTSTHASNGTYSRYVWVLLDINGGGTPHIELSIETNIYSSPRVKDIADGYIPVALVNIEAGSAADATNRSFQMFTQTVSENSVSIGYNSSGYTEKGLFTASGSGLSIAGTTATIVTTPFMSLGNGATNAGEFRLLEDTDNGAHYTGFKAPAAVTSNSVYTMPAAFPGGNRTLQSDASGILSWVTGGGTVSAVANGSNDRVATFSSADALNGEAALTFDGTTLTVDTDFSGTTTATTKAAFIDFDATGITASGQTATNIGLDLDLNSNSPTMVGTVNNTGIDISLTGGTSGTQKNVGINAVVMGADTNYAATLVGGNVGIGTQAPSELLHLVSVDSTKPIILIENQNDDSQEAGITFFKNPISGHSEVADSDDIGIIRFKAMDKGGAIHTYAYMMADSHDADSGTEDGRFLFYLTKAGTDGQEVFRMSSGEACFNEGGADIDFRIESDNNANALVIDAGNDRIGIGKAPLNTIDFGGNEGHSIVKLTATSNAASTFEDYRYVTFANASAVAATMPAGAEGRTYTFKNIHAGQVTITRAGSDEFRVIDAAMGGTANTLVLDVAQYATVVYIAAESMWEVYRGTIA